MTAIMLENSTASSSIIEGMSYEAVRLQKSFLKRNLKADSSLESKFDEQF